MLTFLVPIMHLALSCYYHRTAGLSKAKWYEVTLCRIACDNSRYQIAQIWIYKLCLVLGNIGSSNTCFVSLTEKQVKESWDSGNTAKNTEMFAYWHFLNFAAKLLRVKLNYQNCIECSLVVKKMTGVNTDFAPAVLQRGCSQMQS